MLRVLPHFVCNVLLWTRRSHCIFQKICSYSTEHSMSRDYHFSNFDFKNVQSQWRNKYITFRFDHTPLLILSLLQIYLHIFNIVSNCGKKQRDIILEMYLKKSFEHPYRCMSHSKKMSFIWFSCQNPQRQKRFWINWKWFPKLLLLLISFRTGLLKQRQQESITRKRTHHQLYGSWIDPLKVVDSCRSSTSILRWDNRYFGILLHMFLGRSFHARSP